MPVVLTQYVRVMFKVVTCFSLDGGGRNLLQPDLDLLDGGACLNDPSVNWSYRGEGGANLVVRYAH